MVESGRRVDAQGTGSRADTAALAAALALTRAPALFTVAPDGAVTAQLAPDAAAPEYTLDTIESAARSIAAVVPFPPGLNSASQLDWAVVLGRGLGATVIADADVRRVVQASALRDWAWYAVNHALTADQRRIVESIEAWSAFRGQTGRTPRLARQALELGQTPEGRAFAADLFRGSDGRPRPSRW